MDIETKINTIKEFAEEVINEDELRELFLNQEKNKKKIIAYDGFEPSGQMHIAQGLLRTITVNKLTSMGIQFKFYVADWFGYLNNKMGGDIEKIQTVGKYFIEIWKACGMNLENVEFVWASELIKNPKYWETVLQISTNATVQRVLRCGQIMGREENLSNPSSQILYPIMQAADLIHLEVDIAQLGLDQRKVNMLARDIFPKINAKKPIAIHHKMLLGLQYKETEEKMDNIEKKIAMKMSKSKPDTAILMTDTKEDIFRKFKNAYCPEGETQNNPVLEYAKTFIFEKFDNLLIERPEKFGGNIEIKNYNELEKLFTNKQIHPLDLKNTVAKYIDELIQPVREHFENNQEAKKLLEKVQNYQITR